MHTIAIDQRRISVG